MTFIKEILVPTDFSSASKRALRYACALADAFGASLHVLHVAENPYVPGGYMEYISASAGVHRDHGKRGTATARCGVDSGGEGEIPHRAGISDGPSGTGDPRLPARTAHDRSSDHGDPRPRCRCSADARECRRQGGSSGAVPGPDAARSGESRRGRQERRVGGSVRPHEICESGCADLRNPPHAPGEFRGSSRAGGLGLRWHTFGLSPQQDYALEVLFHVVPTVNGDYPAAASLSSMPPCLLAALPPLPEELEYRFLGGDLILVDLHARLMVDFIPRALRETT